MWNGALMIAPTVCRGFRALYGSWKMICALRRSGMSCLPAQLRDVLAVDHDLAVGRREQPEDRPAGRRLAAAALAHEAERLAGVDAQADAVDRLDLADRAGEEAEVPALDREVLLEVA